MRHTQIRAFHFVALHGGFSRAAEALNQSQPSVSDQVRKLEQAHDTLLFHREGRQVRLTKAGEDLLPLSKRYFEAEDQIIDHLDRSRRRIEGTLRIFTDSAVHITDAIGRFRKANPKAKVVIRTGNTEEVLNQLRNYDAEIGVVGNHQPAPEFVGLPLGQSPIVAIAAHRYLADSVKTLSFEDLSNWPLIFREKGSRTRAGLEAEARSRGMTFNPTIEVEGREAMRDVVASGVGLGFVSAAELGHDDRIRPIGLPGLSASMSETVVYLSMRRDLPVIRGFLKCLKSRI